MSIFEVLGHFLSVYREIIVGLLLVALTTMTIVNRWDQFRIAWTKNWYRLPLAGKLARLARGGHETDDNGWTHGERTLCDDFLQFHGEAIGKDGDYYERCRLYLTKVGENHRRPLPFSIWLLTVVLIFAEALGFGYVLSLYVLPNGSEQSFQVLAALLAFVLAVINVGFTHVTGIELYRNKLAKGVWNSWQNDKSEHRLHACEPTHRISLGEEDPSKRTHNEVDDDEKPYAQVLNRLIVGPRDIAWKMTVATAVLVAVIAIGSTVARVMALSESLTNETILEEQIKGAEAAARTDLPADAIEQLETATGKGRDEATESRILGSWATFSVLAVLYVALQGLAIFFGYNWGFGGRESREAHDFIYRFKTRGEFERYYRQRRERVEKIAQALLSDLQGQARERVLRDPRSNRDLIADHEDRSHHTFLDWIDEQEEIARRDADERAARAEARRTAKASRMESRTKRKPLDDDETTQRPARRKTAGTA